MILAGDVGGTKTALALFEERGRGQAVVREAVLASHGYAALENAIRQFLLEGPPVSIGAACVGVAGPVIDGRCTATNLPWVVDEGSLAASVGTPRVKLVNDLEATAQGVLGLESSALATLQAGVPHKANKALIAAGTGLGEVLLAWDGRRHRVVSSEGGHTDFAPRTDLEIDLFKFLQRGVRARQLRARRLRTRALQHLPVPRSQRRHAGAGMAARADGERRSERGRRRGGPRAS